MNQSEKLKALRAKMAQLGIDAYIQPREDEFQGEQVPDFAERLSWLTGFTGSAGFVVITKDQACLLVDGRYTIQAKNEVDTDLYTVALYTDIHPAKWAADHLSKGQKCGIDPKLFTQAIAKKSKEYIQSAEAELIYLGVNPIDEIWEDQPAPVSKPYFIYPTKLAGQPAKDKQVKIIEELKEKKVSSAFIASPESVAWLLNIRGSDIRMSPLPLCHAVIHENGTVDLLCDTAKIGADVKEHVGSHVNLVSFGDAADYLQKLTGKVLLDPKSASAWVVSNIRAEIIEGTDPCLWPKGQKNDTEIQNMKDAHVIDGVAVTKFLSWLDLSALEEGADELSAQAKLQKFREESEGFLEPSFDTISGFGANGAVVHYRASTKTNLKFEDGGLYLVDSGGQYLKGTTDITRTIAIGEPNREMQENYTRVLKGHIGLAKAKFPKNTNGTSLDAYARAPLWEAGLDYAHGTGHGVGAYLHVHEGPAGISPRSTEPIKEGLILSNEPGYYKEGEYGIRIESLIVITDAGKGPDGLDFLSSETITLAPFDRKLILRELMSPDEIDWINSYHAQVYETLKDLLPKDVQDWCKEACYPL